MKINIQVVGKPVIAEKVEIKEEKIIEKKEIKK